MPRWARLLLFLGALVFFTIFGQGRMHHWTYLLQDADGFRYFLDEHSIYSPSADCYSFRLRRTGGPPAARQAQSQPLWAWSLSLATGGALLGGVLLRAATGKRIAMGALVGMLLGLLSPILLGLGKGPRDEARFVLDMEASTIQREGELPQPFGPKSVAEALRQQLTARIDQGLLKPHE